VDFAVLECARGGLLRAGLGYHHCDIGIVTNVAADHLGLKGIQTIEQLAKVKGVIPETVLPEGYAILNADDDLVYAMRENVKCQVALFSMDEHSPRIQAHNRAGGVSAIFEDGHITICKGAWKIRIVKAVNVPLTFGGRAHFMIQNVLPAVLAGYLRGFKTEDIRMALTTFIPSPSQTPGRLNMFEFRDFKVLVDYAHNPAGMRALQKFVENLEGRPKVGIISGVGDRRDEDTIEIGAVAAETFDELIIRQDKNLRGRTSEELIALLMTGIRSVAPDKPVQVIPSEKEAVSQAIRQAAKDSLIILCSDVVSEALAQVMAFKEEEANRLYEFRVEDIPNL
jgi:cyanophycin synthetase